MPTLFDYMQDTQTLIADAGQQVVDPGDIIKYVNRARREVAMRSSCLRVLTPISGSVISLQVVQQGSGYTAPTLSITPPDFPSGQLPYPNGLQATATATAIGGKIFGANLVAGGAGYFEPIVTVTDPHGTGAVVTATVSGFNQLNEGQEAYPFNLVDLSTFPGFGSIYTIKSVSLIYANYRYSLPCYDFSTYQARIRQYPFQYQYVPTICAQYGQGTNGSFYMYPIPSQTYQMEWDCFCLPQGLTTDQSVEALPEPWTEAVQYWAAYLAYLGMQNFNAARGMKEEFNEMMTRYSGYARPGRVINPYGRY